MKGLRDRILRNLKSIPQVKYIESSPSFSSPSRVLQEICPNAPPPGREKLGDAKEEEKAVLLTYRRPDLDSPSLFDPDLLAAFHLAVADFRRLFKSSADYCPDFETLEKILEGNSEGEEKSRVNRRSDLEEILKGNREVEDETLKEKVETLEEKEGKSREEKAGKIPEKKKEEEEIRASQVEEALKEKVETFQEEGKLEEKLNKKARRSLEKEIEEETLEEDGSQPGQTEETLMEKLEILEEFTREEHLEEEEEKFRKKKASKSLGQDREEIAEESREEEGSQPWKTEETLKEVIETLGESNQEELLEEEEENSKEKKARKSIEQDREEISEETLEEEGRRPIKMRRTKEEGVVLYTTSLGGIRKTFEDCNKVRSLLCSLRVVFDERDLSMHMDYRHELRFRLGGTAAVPPCMFVDGTLVGGADCVLGLHERGELLPLLHHAPFDGSGGTLCQVCAGARFLLCEVCCGSRKVFCKDGGSVRRCSQCNENGLVVCVTCRSRAIPSTYHTLNGASCL